MTKPLSEQARAKLAGVSTATLTTQLFKRGLRNTFVQGARPLNPNTPQMVGPAYTLRYIPAREDIDTIDVFQDRTHPQRAAVEAIPPGSVLVMDCRQDATVASAGSILVTRMMVRGAAGVVSDGGLRDSPEIAKLPFPAYCQGGSAPTNLIKHHAADLNVPIGCGGVPVFPGDICVGDGEGVVIGQGLRYAHAAAYVRATVESAGLKLSLLEDRSARNEDNAPVPGLVAVAAKT